MSGKNTGKILSLIFVRKSKDKETFSAPDFLTIEDVYEPFLIKSGFINRTPRGRVATEFAWHHLGLEAPRKIEE